MYKLKTKYYINTVKKNYISKRNELEISKIKSKKFVFKMYFYIEKGFWKISLKKVKIFKINSGFYILENSYLVLKGKFFLHITEKKSLLNQISNGI